MGSRGTIGIFLPNWASKPASFEPIVTHFILYGRTYCHLCDDMLEALQSLSSEYPFTVEILDVDSDETLLAQFDERVPVLFGRQGDGESVELCHYFFDEAKTRAFLSAHVTS